MEKPPKSPLSSMYDKTYSEHENAFRGGIPDAFVLEAAEQIPTDGQVLEYGAGQGRTALALAERGLSVRAIELSPVGVASMNEAAKDKGLTNFNAEVGDANQPLEGEYDLISSMLMLHHLTREEAVAFIEKIQMHTKEGVLNAIGTFTEDGDFAKEDSEHFYPMAEELQTLYEDWEILTYTKEKVGTRRVHPDGSPMRNTLVQISARKKK